MQTDLVITINQMDFYINHLKDNKIVSGTIIRRIWIWVSYLSIHI